MKTPFFSQYQLITALLLSIASGCAAAEVNVRLGETSLSQDKPLQVTFEATGTSVASPDLTPIQTDFEILNRSVQQRSSTINGRRTQWTSLSLLLRAKRAGKLEIPALHFGGETSRPQTVTILPGTEPAASSPLSQGALRRDLPPPWDSFGMQPTPFGAPVGSGGMDVPFGTASAQLPTFGAAPAMGDKGAPPMAAPVRLANPPLDVVPAPSADADRTWSWIAGIAVAGWLGTLFVCWTQRRQRHVTSIETSVVAPVAVQPPPVLPETPQAAALGKLTTAYRDGDAAGAREALLAWARLTWATNPPGNLSRLAERLSEPLKGHVLELDEALYSPTPVAWEQRRLPDLLRDLAPKSPVS